MLVAYSIFVHLLMFGGAEQCFPIISTKQCTLKYAYGGEHSTFITFLGFSRGFFCKTVVLHATSFQGYNARTGSWTSSHFALLSFGKLIAIAITGIQSHHTLSVCVVNQNTSHD